MFLNILYWLVLVLSCLGYFGPATWPSFYRFGPSVILFAIIGFRAFKIALE